MLTDVYYILKMFSKRVINVKDDCCHVKKCAKIRRMVVFLPNVLFF
jgi:hypothetical protein